VCAASNFTQCHNLFELKIQITLSTLKLLISSAEERLLICHHSLIYFARIPGVWSREVAAMAHLQLPLVPMKHSYVVSNSLPEVRGLPNMRDHDACTYFRIQGEAICMGGYEYNPILLDKVRCFLFT